MRVTYRWIQEYVKSELSPSEMAEQLVRIGHEVEDIIDLGLIDSTICVARINKCEPHPDADKLTVCKVDDGSGQEKTVVCGAPNARANIMGLFAPIGAVLPGGQKMKKAKSRGVQSEGMLLAPDEAGMGNEHKGIIEIEDDALKPGDGYDVIYDLEITPNRPDCLSVWGVSRDLATSLGKKIFKPKNRLNESYDNVRDMALVSIKCPDDCPRYIARVIKEVQIAPSPMHIQNRLHALGLRPINNVVDATNIALMEYGHPLHAFDYDKITDHHVIIRLAEENEKINLLDESTLQLTKEDMVIADPNGPIALAGIMGGAESEVTPKTKNILLESAYFNPTTIRKTSSKHNLSTDASYRFERGTNIQALSEAADYVAYLIQSTADGTLGRGSIDEFVKKPDTQSIMLRADRANAFLGTDISTTQMADILSLLGFDLVRSESDMLVLEVPPHRVDISCEEDLFEEIARIYGYGEIPSTLPYLMANEQPLNQEIAIRRLLQDQLVSLGFLEAINLSFMSEAQVTEIGLPTDGLLRLTNPMSAEQAILRPDLTPSILQNLLHNQNHGVEGTKLFEYSRTFLFGDMATPTVENETLVMGIIGKPQKSGWRDREDKKYDFYDMKGAVEALLESLGFTGLSLDRSGLPDFLHPGRAARIQEGDVTIGWLGEINPVYVEKLGFRDRPVIAEFIVEEMIPRINAERKVREIPRLPAIERDLAVVVSKSVPAQEIEQTIRKKAGPFLEELFLFDLYEGEQVGKGKRSLAYRAIYRAPDRTLTDDEIDQRQKAIIKALESDHGAKLRQ